MSADNITELTALKLELRNAAGMLDRITSQAVRDAEALLQLREENKRLRQAAQRDGVVQRGPYRVRSMSPEGREEMGEPQFLHEVALWEAFLRASTRQLVEVLGADGVVVACVKGDLHPMTAFMNEHNDLKRRFRLLDAEHKSLLAQMGTAA
jgi:hypothetical protein